MKISVKVIGDREVDRWGERLLQHHKEIKKEMSRAARDVRDEFEKTVSTWSKKPKFDIDDFSNNQAIIYDVFTDNTIYSYVNDGTRPHIIRPVNSPVLAFQLSIAKTIPRVIASNAGRSFGPTIFAREVHHPGSEAREFDQQIASDIDRDLANRIFKIIDKD